jgi:hypothetical protein
LGDWGKGSRERHRGREDEMMENESKYHRWDGNIYSIECETGDESLGCSGLKGRRSHKPEGLIRRKSSWSHNYWEDFRELRRHKSVQMSRRGKVWRFEERDTNRYGGGGNKNSRKDSRRPSHGPQKGTRPDLDATSECLRTAVIIE